MTQNVYDDDYQTSLKKKKIFDVVIDNPCVLKNEYLHNT